MTYLEWLIGNVTDELSAAVGGSYSRLFDKLYRTEFVVILPFDENRLLDGLLLREKYNGPVDIGPCSVLEVLISLAHRCEDQIMHNNDIGERSGEWFWEMLANMGLGVYSDDRYNEQDVDDILRKFLFHDYNDKDTLGCAFRSSEYPDLSSFELWQQMNFHLNDLLGGK